MSFEIPGISPNCPETKHPTPTSSALMTFNLPKLSFARLIYSVIACSVTFTHLSTQAAAPAANAAGTWKWTLSVNDSPVEANAELKQEGERLTGTYKSSLAGESPIKQGKIEGDKVTFTVDRQIQDTTFTLKFEGKLKGDTIEGKIKMENGDREFDWLAKRTNSAVDPTGKWDWTTVTSNDRNLTAILELKREGQKVTGKMQGDTWELPISEGKIEGNELTFTTTRDLDDGSKTVYKSSGKISGNTINGKVEYKSRDGESRTTEWKATRKTAGQ
jgi:hypothetical protein